MRPSSRFRLIAEFLFFYGGSALLIYFVRERALMVALMWGGALGAFLWLKKHYSVTHTSDWNYPGAKAGLREVLRRFAVLAPALLAFTWLYDPARLFSFPLERPRTWLMVMLLYPILSVWPQEILFRCFMLHRYRPLFSVKQYVWASAAAFSFVHLVFSNWVAISFTAAGGFMFAHTYVRHRSLALVCLEHALYGCFIFTIGLGYYFYSAAWAR